MCLCRRLCSACRLQTPVRARPTSMCIFRRLCTNLCTYESWKSINCCFLVHRYLTRSTVHPIGPRKCVNPAFQSKDIPYTAFYASTCTSVVHKMACCGIYAYAWKHQFLHEWKPGTCTEPFWMYVNIRKHHSVLSTEVTVPIQKVVYCMLSHVHASLCTTKVNVDIISCGRLCSVCPLPSSASLYTCKNRA